VFFFTFILFFGSPSLMCWISLDPNTQAWLKGAFDPIFGFPSIVRFSWATVKVLLENGGHKVKW